MFIKTVLMTVLFIVLVNIPTFGASEMIVESVTADSNAITVNTTGATYIIKQKQIQMFRRVDPKTNKVNPRLVAKLEFVTDIGELSIESHNKDNAVVQSSLASFKFNADSLFFITARSPFNYAHTNLIADAPWNKGAGLDRMWTDGYGGSLHADVNNGAAVFESGTDYTTISMTSCDVMAHMVYPPRFFDFESLYGRNARPFVHLLMPNYMDELKIPGGLQSFIENGFGAFVLWANIYDNPNDYPSRPILLDNGIIGYKVKDSASVRDFIKIAHENGFKTLSYIVFLRNPKWKYPEGHPKAGQYQDVEVTLEWMRKFQKDYDFDGWYIDGAETGDFMTDYNFMRQVRADIGDSGIIYYHDSIDPWGYNLGREYRFCGLKAVFLNTYADYSLSGEMGDIATVNSPNDKYYRFYTCGYGMGQTYCAHKRKTYMDIAISEQENNRLVGENLFGAQRTNKIPLDDSWKTHFKTSYDIRKAQYLSGNFDPGIQWPIDSNTGWFRRPLNIKVDFLAGTSVQISWETQQPADSEVAYTSNGIWWPRPKGKSGPDATVKKSDMVTKHNIILSDLNPHTDYIFRIRSSNCKDVPEEIIWGYVDKFKTAEGAYSLLSE